MAELPTRGWPNCQTKPGQIADSLTPGLTWTAANVPGVVAADNAAADDEVADDEAADDEAADNKAADNAAADNAAADLRLAKLPTRGWLNRQPKAGLIANPKLAELPT